MLRNWWGMTLVARWIVVGLMALFPIASHAMALGRLQVISALNEPLNAQIELSLVDEKELKGLSVSLASLADFNAASVDRPPFLTQIKFTVVKKPDGHYFIELHTDDAVNEPFLHLLIQLDWPGGRLVREYTALIDPPYAIANKAPAPVEVPTVAAVAAPTPAPVAAPAAPSPAAAVPPVEAPNAVAAPATAKPEAAKAAEQANTQAAPPSEETTPQTPSTEAAPAAPVVEPLAAKPKAETAPAPAAPPQATPEMKPAPAPVLAAMSEYDVKRGDTLWRIAEKTRAGDKQVTVEQVILAIYRTNKADFFGNNVNNLKAGKILKIPESKEAETVPAPKAQREFHAQYDAWQEYKLKLAGASHLIKVNETPEMTANEKAAEPIAKPTLPVVANKAPAEPTPPAPGAAEKSQPAELLKIVRSTQPQQQNTPDMKASEKESAHEDTVRERQALADRAATLEESLESKQLENKDLSEKVGIVRAQLKKESRLIALESQSLAPRKQQTPEIKPPETVAKVSAVKPPAPKPEQLAKVVPLPPPAKIVPAAVAPKKRFLPPPPVKEEDKGFLATVLAALQSDLLMPAIIGIVVLLGGGVALVYFRRRQKSIAEFEESILSADAISTEQPATTGTPAGQQQPAVTAGGDTSFLSDFSQGGMGNIHTDEVDPVAEAEVYLAYGRDETAEEILKEAMVKNPDRHELKLKLLEIYHQRNDVPAFETLAEELYASLAGRGGKVWEKVEEMGRKLNPENPMFRGGAPAKSPASTTQVTKQAAPGITAPTARTEPRIDMPVAASATVTAKTEMVGDIDFNVAAVPAADDHDIALASPPAPANAVAEDAGYESLDFNSPADNALDFDIGAKADAFPESGHEAASVAAPASNEVKWEPNKVAMPDIDLATASPAPAPAGDGQASAQWDETATKLDLAKAYIDMGDAEGARSILQEVMTEGSEAQKKQAHELSSQIA
ncbi:MAG: FimV/HubP family polar landmark protein [Sulfuricaulis sp.]